MRAVIWWVLLFGGAVLAATFLGSNDGLVTIYWASWRLDVSLNLFVLALVVLYAVVLLAVRGTEALVSLPRRAAQWRALQRERAAQGDLREGQQEYLAGRFSRAAKTAQRALGLSEGQPAWPGQDAVQVQALLLWARSAHRLQDRSGRDRLMARLDVLMTSTGARTGLEGLRLMEVSFALDDREPSRALELLQRLPPGVSRRTQALRLKLSAARQSGHLAEALHTARLLTHHGGLSPDAGRTLARTLAIQMVDEAADIDSLRQAWQSLSESERSDVSVACQAARRAGALGAAVEGRRWLRPMFARQSSLAVEDRQALSLALCDLMDELELDWLQTLEQAQARFPTDAWMAISAGLAFAQRELWGKARLPLEQAARSDALDVRLRRRALLVLAHMARDKGDEGLATAHERDALRLP
jgi:HemY protein